MPHSISAALVCESQMEPSVAPSKGPSRTTAPPVPRVVDVQRGCPIRCTDPGCYWAADREMTYPGCRSRACQAGESTAQSDTVIPAPGNSPSLCTAGQCHHGPECHQIARDIIQGLGGEVSWFPSPAFVVHDAAHRPHEAIEAPLQAPRPLMPVGAQADVHIMVMSSSRLGWRAATFNRSCSAA
jgi:hypothetical protein